MTPQEEKAVASWNASNLIYRTPPKARSPAAARAPRPAAASLRGFPGRRWRRCTCFGR